MALEFVRMFENYFQPRDLRRAVLHPLRHESAERIVEIIHLRLLDPKTNPPLQIFTYGGSVLWGSDAFFNEWWLPNATIENDMHSIGDHANDFPWPIRLEEVWNDALFGQRDVVRVHNMASGGTSTEMGVVSLEYRLFEKTTGVQPDIIIHAFGNNDILQYRDDELMYDQHIRFVEAARKLRCDDEHLPAIMFFDDHIGIDEEVFLSHHVPVRYFRSVAQVSSWYDLLAVSLPNNFREVHYAEENRTRLGIGKQVHPQMLYHCGVAPWLFTYGLLSGLVTFCIDEQAERMDGAKAGFRSRGDDLSKAHIPELKEEYYKPSLFPDVWKNRTAADGDRCDYSSSTSSASLPPPSAVCTPESWIANWVGGMYNHSTFEEKLSSINITDLIHWTEGKPKPLIAMGLKATETNASFVLTIPEAIESMHLVLISIKSYGEKWKDSMLRITARHPHTKTGLGVFFVSGLHGSSTSVPYVHKFLLDPSNLTVGKPVEARFDLVGGYEFKIIGLMFCSQ